MKLSCPYCKEELIEGFIYGGRYSFKWYDKNMNFIERYSIFGGEILSDNPRGKCYRCIECNKIVIDINEL